jgi:hypothetical protein
MLAFRSLDPFRALREPDRRRRDEERLSRSEQRTLSKNPNNHLTGKAPYKFESPLLQQGVMCEPDLLRCLRVERFVYRTMLGQAAITYDRRVAAEQKQCDVLLMAKIEEHPLREG